MGTFDHESLWNKSTVFIKRGIEARDDARFEDFELWASLAFELLGKAALAKIHPALVADPQQSESLFTACGHPVGDKRKTIQAKTLFERLKHVSTAFDQTALDFCQRMAERRNGELHSGELPFAGRNVEAWNGRYWQIVSVVLQAQGKQLEDWIGKDEAKGATDIIAKTVTATQHAIEKRIAKYRALFEKKAPPDSPMRQFLQQQAKQMAQIECRLSNESEGADETPCPACGSTGTVAGEFWDTVGKPEVEYDDDTGYAVELVRALYGAEVFSCTACGLLLEGKLELEAAELGEDFERTIEREPDDGDAYGND